MDAKARFFARMDARADQPELTTLWPGRDEPPETTDLDIDFSVTESGRTVAQVVGVEGEKSALDDMDFSITNSSRISEQFQPFLSERSGVSTMSCGTIGSIGNLSSVFEPTSSQRTESSPAEYVQQLDVVPPEVQSQQQHQQNQNDLGQQPLLVQPGQQQPQQQQQQQQQQPQQQQQHQLQEQQQQLPQQQQYQQQFEQYQQQQQQQQQQDECPQSPQFQTLPEVSHDYHHQRQVHGNRPRSAPRAIPSSNPQPIVSSRQNASALGSQPSSAGSTASSFLNNILTPAASSTFNNTQLCHTPPTNLATSYEAAHFGKRARSGSISERLRVSSELEEKGLIDKEQKEILKDLIISGDDDLQQALEKYEQGDQTMLETMIHTGSLSNRATQDIDLLGDLDLDFLTVHDDLAQVDNGHQHLMAGNDAVNLLQHNPPPPGTHSVNHPMQPPPSLPTREQAQQFAVGSGAPSAMAQLEASDGIGELDFDGGFGAGDVDEGFLNLQSQQVRAPSPPAMLNVGNDRRLRSNSTISVDLDMHRPRANSMFSALIQSTDPMEDGTSQYGRWMDRIPEPTPQGGIEIQKFSRRASAPTRSALAISLEEQEPDTADPGDLQMHTEMAPAETPTLSEKDARMEQKRRERQQKKEQREREKREKKERRDQLKLEKQKKAEMEEREEHQPGSGRPRSMSDPNIRSTVDEDGLLHVDRPDGWIGAYSPESRKVRIQRFLEKRNHRVWTKTVKYDVRKNFADSRLRVKGRFVKKEDELLMRELMSLT